MNLLKENNLALKIIIANIIDIAIPTTPVIYSFFFKDLAIFDYLTMFELIGIIYLIFNLLAYNFSKGSTIGENLNKIHLVDAKNEKKNHLKNIFRILFIAGFLFYFQKGESFSYEMVAALFFLIIPIQFNYNGKIIHSILNFSLKLQYKLRTFSNNKENVNKAT